MAYVDHHIVKSTFPRSGLILVFTSLCLMLCLSCQDNTSNNNEESIAPKKELAANDILGNPEYQAISYGGYRNKTRDTQPTIAELKEDMNILAAMNIKIIRTYQTKLPQAGNVLKAIRELKNEDPAFEMYVMLGVWIDCKDARTEKPDHNSEDVEANAAEIQRAVDMATEYPDIVKVIAVGNEAMVKWASEYFVQPDVILKWVNHLQSLKQQGNLPASLWITSSDNFASWGGGGAEYHKADLTELMKAVDYISIHTYPMHDTHYNSAFWGVEEGEITLSDRAKINAAMLRARDYAISQHQNTVAYIKSLGIDKPVHIGETGWASVSDGLYSPDGSRACDEYKQGIYYTLMRDWAKETGISCFFFEAFDEPWKGGDSPGDSEKHFGLFDVNGKAKYAIWDEVDQGLFKGLSRGGSSIERTYNGNKDSLLNEVLVPPLKK